MKIQAFIDQAIADNKTALLDHDWCDSFSYYEQDIIKAYKEIHDSAPDDLIDKLIEEQEQRLEYHSPGNLRAVPEVFCFDMISGVTLEIPEQLKRRNKEIINRCTDLYISDSGFCQVHTGFDFIGINLNEATR